MKKKKIKRLIKKAVQAELKRRAEISYFSGFTGITVGKRKGLSEYGRTSF